MTTIDEDIENATDEGHVDTPNESNEEGSRSRRLKITSVVFGKDQAEILRKKYDTDGDNYIDAQELARITADMLIQNRNEKKHLKWALIASLAAVVILLCSTFATSWATAVLSRKVTTNDNTGDLISEETGWTVATRPRNDLITVQFNPEFTERMMMRRLEERSEESDKRFMRFLEDTPVSEDIPAAEVHMLWEHLSEGTLGDCEVVTKKEDTGEINVAKLEQNPISRTRKGDNYIYCPISLIGYGADNRFNLVCPRGNRGVCSAYLIVDSINLTRMLIYSPDGCFSSASTVELEGGKTLVSMRDLSIGDKILVSENKYQAIYSFGHKHHNLEATYLQMFTSASALPLEITSDHLVFLYGEDIPVPASLIKAGDLLAGSKSSKPERVINIASITREGLYAPFTADGTIVVNGIQASTYVSFQPNKSHVEIGGIKIISWHAIEHAWMAPYRLFCTSIISPGMCKKNESYDEFGLVEWSTGAGVRIIEFTFAHSVWVQVFMVFTVGICWAVLFLLASLIAKPGLLILVVAIFLAAKKRVASKKQAVDSGLRKIHQKTA
jgi:hypothetical protein